MSDISNSPSNLSQSAIVLSTDVLIVGGGTGGTAAAIQAARRGANTVLVSEFPWLGGMLTSAGVSAPDGNELDSFQTGLWGEFLRELQQRHPEGLDHGWVSFFTYAPQIGAAIFADWVAALPNLHWISGKVPLEVLREGDRILGVQFDNLTVYAQVVIDGTELGDLLELGHVPHRWGWELQAEWNEPSAPIAPSVLTATYPVQAPTWVVILRDFKDELAPEIPCPPHYNRQRFEKAWEQHGAEAGLNYGRLPNDRFMLNWPIHGNDYGEDIDRLIRSPEAKAQFLQEALWHTQGFAHFIQTQLGRRYGLADDTFPILPGQRGGGAFALHPYYRESRRLRGITTVTERSILPSGNVAPLPMGITAQGCEFVETWTDAIAIGNYANDHHYPSGDIPLAPKSIHWGGRWTGTPFTIPYRSLIPETIDGFLVCEKNISVSHMANGATRLQPLVLGIGQAAGMAAALCVERSCQPRDLPVRMLQEALIADPIAPAAVLPFFNLAPTHPDWQFWQRYYLDHPESYPTSGTCPAKSHTPALTRFARSFSGTLSIHPNQTYSLTTASDTYGIVTVNAEVAQALHAIDAEQPVTGSGRFNPSGDWILVEAIDTAAGQKS